MRNNFKVVAGALASTALAAVLAACGSSGSGPVSAATVSGVAATGLAIANGQVSLKCTVGDASPVRTLADGSYSIDVSALTLPCVARVDFYDTATGAPQELHSLVQAAGKVNITPVTDMIVANLSATGVAADAYDKFDANEIKAYSAERIRTASQTVKTELLSKGIDITHLPDDPIGAELQASDGASQGDAHDGVLDQIRAKLDEQGKTLHDLETEMHSGHETRGLTTSTGQPGDAAAGKTAYETNCQACHGARMPDAVNAANILNAIQKNEGGMGILASSLTSVIADNIATYMADGVSSGTGTGAALTAQTITFASPGDQTLGVAPPVLSATATSGLAVSVTSSTPAVCTVADNTLTLVAAGSCSLSANQSGDATYNAAPTVTHAFAVTDPTGATSAANGKALYASNNCGSCHGTVPANLNVLAGANNPSVIQGAINSNFGGMARYSGLTSQNLADIAAYLATPSI